MIKPTKYLDLSTCVIKVASSIIEILLKAKAISLSELEEKIVDVLGEPSKYNFLLALNLLFLTGSIDYDDNNDAIYFLAKLPG